MSPYLKQRQIGASHNAYFKWNLSEEYGRIQDVLFAIVVCVIYELGRNRDFELGLGLVK